MKPQSSIKSAVANELLRIVCFLVYYVILVGIGAAILIGAFWASDYLLLHLLPGTHNLRIVIIIVMLVVGMWMLALMLLGVYLIKPLFSFNKNTKSTSVEEVKSIIAHEFGHFSQNSIQ